MLLGDVRSQAALQGGKQGPEVFGERLSGGIAVRWRLLSGKEEHVNSYTANRICLHGKIQQRNRL